MKTSSLLLYTVPGRIGIARFAPRRTPAGYRMFKPLAPGPWLNGVDEATLYFRELSCTKAPTYRARSISSA